MIASGDMNDPCLLNLARSIVARLEDERGMPATAIGTLCGDADSGAAVMGAYQVANAIFGNGDGAVRPDLVDSCKRAASGSAAREKMRRAVPKLQIAI